MLSQFFFPCTAKEKRQIAVSDKGPGQTDPEGQVRMFEVVTCPEYQPQAPAFGRAWQMLLTGEIFQRCDIQTVEVSPVQCIVAVILGEGVTVELPETVNMQA